MVHGCAHTFAVALWTRLLNAGALDNGKFCLKCKLDNAGAVCIRRGFRCARTLCSRARRQSRRNAFAIIKPSQFGWSLGGRRSRYCRPQQYGAFAVCMELFHLCTRIREFFFCVGCVVATAKAPPPPTFSIIYQTAQRLSARLNATRKTAVLSNNHGDIQTFGRIHVESKVRTHART